MKRRRTPRTHTSACPLPLSPSPRRRPLRLPHLHAPPSESSHERGGRQGGGKSHKLKAAAAQESARLSVAAEDEGPRGCVARWDARGEWRRGANSSTSSSGHDVPVVPGGGGSRGRSWPRSRRSRIAQAPPRQVQPAAKATGAAPVARGGGGGGPAAATSRPTAHAIPAARPSRRRRPRASAPAARRRGGRGGREGQVHGDGRLPSRQLGGADGSQRRRAIAAPVAAAATPRTRRRVRRAANASRDSRGIFGAAQRARPRRSHRPLAAVGQGRAPAAAASRRRGRGRRRHAGEGAESMRRAECRDGGRRRKANLADVNLGDVARGVPGVGGDGGGGGARRRGGPGGRGRKRAEPPTRRGPTRRRRSNRTRSALCVRRVRGCGRERGRGRLGGLRGGSATRWSERLETLTQPPPPRNPRRRRSAPRRRPSRNRNPRRRTRRPLARTCATPRSLGAAAGAREGTGRE